MLATMRPVQHYPPNSHGNSRSTSRNSNYSPNNTGSPSASPSRAASAKLSRTNSNNSETGKQFEKGQASAAAGGTRLPKKPIPSSLSVEVEAIEQTKPGLITLSKPLESGEKKGKGRGQAASASDGVRGRQQYPSADEGVMLVKGPRGQRKKKAGAALVEEAKATGDVAMLSKSAPTSNKLGAGEWEMPSRGENKTEAPLTWQQQMTTSTSTSTSTPDKKKSTTTTKKAGKKGATTTPSTPSNKESLTWQQELLGSNKPRGPAFDVFADARDEATFGASGDQRVAAPKPKKQGGGARKRADSVGELRLLSHANGPISAGPPTAPLSSSNSGPSVIGVEGPSTPNGKFAYAGPNFHNSPSPASLPVPKFLSQKGGSELPKSPSTLFAREAMMRRKANGSSESNDGDGSEDEDSEVEDQKRRSIRGVTAPPQLQSASREDDSGDRSVTIESLLAKMMRTGSG